MRVAHSHMHSEFSTGISNLVTQIKRKAENEQINREKKQTEHQTQPKILNENLFRRE